VEAENQVAHAIATRSLAVRELRSEKVQDTDNILVKAILKSAIRDTTLPNAIVEELSELTA
jgi:hypothetical protein